MQRPNQFLKRKLTLITMVTSGAALILLSAAFLIYDLISFRHSLSRDLTAQAQVIGNACTLAMASKDPAAAAHTLSALKSREDIVAAVLYTNDGKVFSQYTRGNIPFSPPPALAQGTSKRLEGSSLKVFQDISLDGKDVGTLYLESDLSRWTAQAKQYAMILAIFMLAATPLLYGSLRRFISRQRLQFDQISHLQATMKLVSSMKDFGVRASKGGNDEIGSLIDDFNGMLAETQSHVKELDSRAGSLEGEIVHRKRAEEELLKAKHAAELASRAKSCFLANMSHELRTPLNAIIGYSEMLEEEAEESGNGEQTEDLRKIQNAGKHLLALINDILDLSKIEAGKMQCFLEDFNIREMIEEMVPTMQPVAAKNGNLLRLNLAEDPGMMHADITKVKQILLNLLSNACKFTENGTITVNVDRSTVAGQDWIQFQIADSGIGMDPEQMANLFREYTQANISISRKYGGTGLGLAICHRFAKLMKGNIRVESKRNQGTTFTVHIPAVVTTETAAALAEKTDFVLDSAEDAKLRVGVILVIDNDPRTRDLTFRFLNQTGYLVVAAANEEEGLRLATRLQPVAITLNFMLPEMKGWNLSAKLKASSALAKTLLLLVTSVDSESINFDSGPSSYVITTTDSGRLASILRKEISSHVLETSTRPAPTVIPMEYRSGWGEKMATDTIQMGASQV
jgi:signal transduction histidine kinase/CheY-like chemotaxis protein